MQDLEIMKLIDEQYMKTSFWGVETGVLSGGTMNVPLGQMNPSYGT
jgi:hypothetical protein